MLRTVRFTLMVIFSIGLFLAGTLSVSSQSGPDARATYELNVRAGPDVSRPVITILPANTGIIFEGRNADMSWLLGHTEDGTYRGWVASLYLTYAEGFSASRLPLSDEVMPFQAPAGPAAPVGSICCECIRPCRRISAGWPCPESGEYSDCACHYRQRPRDFPAWTGARQRSARRHQSGRV